MGKRTKVKNEDGTPHVKRPKNCFMIYMQQNREAFCIAHPKMFQSNVCKSLGYEWRQLTPSQKEPYRKLAELESKIHGETNPDFKYRPVKKIQKTAIKKDVLKTLAETNVKTPAQEPAVQPLKLIRKKAVTRAVRKPACTPLHSGRILEQTLQGTRKNNRPLTRSTKSNHRMEWEVAKREVPRVEVHEQEVTFKSELKSETVYLNQDLQFDWRSQNEILHEIPDLIFKQDIRPVDAVIDWTSTNEVVQETAITENTPLLEPDDTDSVICDSTPDLFMETSLFLNVQLSELLRRTVPSLSPLIDPEGPLMDIQEDRSVSDRLLGSAWISADPDDLQLENQFDVDDLPVEGEI